MQAVSFSALGGPEVLQVVETPMPEPGPGQVRLAVRAAGVNPLDWKIRRGLMAPRLPAALPSIPGYDVAGVVDAVGDGVTSPAVGTDVLGGSATGAYAEYALAEATAVVERPSTVAWEVAAGFDSAARTAARVLALLQVQAGQTVLVHGGAGAVGQLAVQLAVHRGARVVATASTRRHDGLRALGARPVAYGEGMAELVRAAAPDGIDRVVDAAGQGDLAVLVALAGSPDRVVTIADPAAAQFGVRFSAGARGADGGAADERAVLRELVSLLAAGDLTLAIQQVFPLADAAAAQTLSEEGHASGKIILDVAVPAS